MLDSFTLIASDLIIKKYQSIEEFQSYNMACWVFFATTIYPLSFPQSLFQ